MTGLYDAASEALKDRTVAQASPIFMRMLKREPPLLAELGEKYLHEVAMGRTSHGGQDNRVHTDHGAHAPDTSGGGHGADAIGQSGLAAADPRGEGQVPLADDGQKEDATTTGFDQADYDVPTADEASAAGRVLAAARKAGAGALRAAAYEYREQVHGESWLLSHKLAVNDRPFMSLDSTEIEPMAERTVKNGVRHMVDLVLLYVTLQMVKNRRLQPGQTLDKTLTTADILKMEQAMKSEQTRKEARAWIKKFAQDHVLELEDADA